MADWGNAVGQGLAAAANSGVDTLDRQMKEEADNRAANRDLDIKVRLAAATQQLQYQADDRKRALAVQQGKAINEGATGLLNSNVATRINSTLGSTIDPTNPDSKATIEAIRNNPDAAKAYGVEPDSDLVKAKARADSARNIGDLSAAAEEDKNVRNLVTDQRNVKTDERENKRLDNLQDFQKAQTERQQTLAEATLAYQNRMAGIQERIATSTDMRANSAESRAQEQVVREQRLATSTALKSVQDDINKLQTVANSPLNLGVDPTTKQPKAAPLLKQIESLRQEESRYRQALAGTGVPLPDTPTNAAPTETPTAASNQRVLADPTLAPAYIKRFGQAAYDALVKSSPKKPTGGLLQSAAPAPSQF